MLFKNRNSYILSFGVILALLGGMLTALPAVQASTLTVTNTNDSEVSYLTISGNVGVGGAVLQYGYSLFTTANNSGDYLFNVLPGWSGTVIPSKQGYSFAPVKRNYTNVQNNQANQNFSAVANTFTDPKSPGDTWRVSVASDGGEPDGWSVDPSISADGRYVAYSSQATNIVPGDFANDVFVYDNQTGQTTSVSLDSDGTPFNCNSGSPSISADGRYVAFSSCYQGSGSYWVVYVYDRQTGTLDSANRGLTPSISADGRYVAYLADDNQFRNIFVRDMLTDNDTEVTISLTGGQPNGNSWVPSISANGRYVAFNSEASNLVNSDTNGVGDIFLYDLQTNERTRVSVRSNGVQANAESFMGSISGDGRYVTFTSAASNLVNNDTNNEVDAFVHDRQTGETIRVSVSTNGIQGNGDSNLARISADGRYVVFRSIATNLISGDTNGVADIFMYDRQTSQTRRVSVGSNGREANGDSPPLGSGFAISADGKYLAFSSDATNLVETESDTNAETDVFVHKIPPTNIQVSIAGSNVGSYYIPLHSGDRYGFAVDNGPAAVVSTNGVDIITALRVIWQEPAAGRTSYSEMMGLPVEQLSSEYWFPWYNNLDTNVMSQGFRIANVDSTQTTIKVMLGATELDSFTLQAGESVRVNYAVNDGPIQIYSEGGEDILAALRVIWTAPVHGRYSYSEMMG
ncbi:MAG TPA: hypothetical protein VFD54_09450, partial [Anaerolineales bacterium]|nr:hypothetical protein [Anaerolineales bacterium]